MAGNFDTNKGTERWHGHDFQHGISGVAPPGGPPPDSAASSRAAPIEPPRSVDGPSIGGHAAPATGTRGRFAGVCDA